MLVTSHTLKNPREWDGMNERTLVTAQIGAEGMETHRGLANSSKSRHTQEIK